MAKPVWSEVEGWLLPKEADLLRKYNTGVWCEIGSWKGRSTLVLAEGGNGYAIDTFTGSEEHGKVNTLQEFIHNIREVKNHITVYKDDFRNVHKKVGKVDLLFLDADHSYEATKEAFELYAPKVKKGGVVILHDVWGYDGNKDTTHYPGVKKFALELLDNPEWEHIEDAMRCMAIKRL